MPVWDIALAEVENLVNFVSARLLGLSSADVQIKYVNFCWRYAYRLWCNKMQLTGRESRLNAEEENAHKQIAATSSELHGDTHNEEAMKNLVDPGDHMKLRALQKLANRVNKFAEVLQGDPGDAVPSEIPGYPHDEQVLTRLREQLHGPHDHDITST